MDGERFIRPEKIRIIEDGESTEGMHTESGHIVEVAYVGMVTRLHVRLDSGGTIQLARQNLDTESSAKTKHQRSGDRWLAVGSHRPDPAANRKQERSTGGEAFMKTSQSKPVWVAWLLVLSLFGALFVASAAARVPMTAVWDEVTSIGKTEGQVNLIAWAGYAEDGSTDPEVDWVTDFTKQTGCKVNTKTAGTSDEMVQLMRTGQVRRCVGFR